MTPLNSFWEYAAALKSYESMRAEYLAGKLPKEQESEIYSLLHRIKLFEHDMKHKKP